MKYLRAFFKVIGAMIIGAYGLQLLQFAFTLDTAPLWQWIVNIVIIIVAATYYIANDKH